MRPRFTSAICPARMMAPRVIACLNGLSPKPTRARQWSVHMELLRIWRSNVRASRLVGIPAEEGVQGAMVVALLGHDVHLLEGIMRVCCFSDDWNEVPNIHSLMRDAIWASIDSLQGHLVIEGCLRLPRRSRAIFNHG